MPASASVPSRATQNVSISPVDAWASITRMFGHAIRSSIGTIGSCSSAWVRAEWGRAGIEGAAHGRAVWLNMRQVVLAVA